MKRFVSAVMVIVCIICIIPYKSEYDSSAEFDDAKAYVLMEAGTRTVLEEKNGDMKLNAGYLTKLMSLLLIAEDIETGKYRLDTTLTASQSVQGTKGAVIWLEPGDQLSAEELVKSVIIGNANDALIVLAERSEQTVDAFVQRMNAEAFDLGLRDTAFYSPCGYPDSREYTTAHDMAVICAELSKYEFFRDYFCTWRDFVKSGQTELVSESSLARTYERHIGFKACHSDVSGYCVAEGGRENGVTYIAVVLGAPDADASLGSVKKLVNRGFSGYKVTATMFPDEMMMPMKVVGGEENSVEISLRTQRALVVPRGAEELSCVVVLPEFINAPVRKGQRIGTAAFYNEKNLVCEESIIAAGDVEGLSYGFVLQKLLLNVLK